METLFVLGLAMVVGLLFNRVVKRIGLPNVTGYLVAGLLIGPAVLGLFTEQAAADSVVITNVALGFIAFSIGGEFKWSAIKHLGKSVITITMFQAIAACALVDAVLLVAGFPAPLALTLGAIATATAPAATLMVVRQYNAKGPVTQMLLPVVALDDAIGLVVFSISLSVAQTLTSGEAATVGGMLLAPFKEIGLSLVIGAAIGLALAFAVKYFHSRANRLCLVVCAVFLGASMADKWGLSSLLLCMAAGAVMVNLREDSDKVLDVTDAWTPPLFLLFFVISGAELDPKILPSVGLLGLLYLLARSAGKCVGATLGSKLAKAHPNVQKYLGITLLPQAGVAIGMSQIVISALPEYGAEIRAVALCATLIYELVGPLLTKIALTKAGEIQKKAA